jgi:hypothetical protein
MYKIISKIQNSGKPISLISPITLIEDKIVPLLNLTEEQVEIDKDNEIEA